MRMGLGIFLLVVGGILAFAVRDVISGVNLAMIGYICMAAGVLALVLEVIGHTQATRTKNTQVVEHREDLN